MWLKAPDHTDHNGFRLQPHRCACNGTTSSDTTRNAANLSDAMVASPNQCASNRRQDVLLRGSKLGTASWQQLLLPIQPYALCHSCPTYVVRTSLRLYCANTAHQRDCVGGRVFNAGMVTLLVQYSTRIRRPGQASQATQPCNTNRASTVRAFTDAYCR